MNSQFNEQESENEARTQPVVSGFVGRRMFVAGVAGVGLASVLGAGIVFAHDDTEGDTDDLEGDTDESEDDNLDDSAESERGESYQDFLTKLTANLGLTDTTTVDLAIRDSLKAIVDEKLTEGSISQNDADALKERIDTGASPLGVAGIAAAGVRGRGRRRERRKNAADGSENAPEQTPASESTPTI